MIDLEQELRDYMQSEEFAHDCAIIKKSYALYEEELPDDLEIEEQAVCEKRIYFETVKQCIDKGHDWCIDEEEVGGQTEKYRYCRRCGKSESIT